MSRLELALLSWMDSLGRSIEDLSRAWNTAKQGMLTQEVDSYSKPCGNYHHVYFSPQFDECERYGLLGSPGI